MKKVIYKVLSLLFAGVCLTACDNDIKDIDKVEEKLTLIASAESIALDENNMQKDIITFTWTQARDIPGDHLISYTTKLDIVGNNFGSSTAILTYEDDGVFSRSFTSEQLNNWANDKWKLKVNKEFTLEFRVVAQWEGGSTFESPEVRTVTVDVQPIKVEVFGADNMYIDGSAIADQTEMNQTLENESQYAWLGDLMVGELQIPVELEGEIYYIVPEDGNGTLKAGEAQPVRMQETPISWNIPTDGEYRVVVNMDQTTITIYTPDKPLAPAVVEWPLTQDDEVTNMVTEVNNIWHYGEPTGWGWKTGDWTQSMADPQIFIYSGSAITGRTKFGIYPHNQSFVYTGNNTASNTSVTLGKEADLVGGYSGNERNAYFSLPAGTNFIILDIRNMKMTAYSR